MGFPGIDERIWYYGAKAQVTTVDTEAVRDILFIRQYPTALARQRRISRLLASWLDSRGVTVPFCGHKITFYLCAFGGRLRPPHPELLERLGSGAITDIVDVGGAGALDPLLRRGDLVLSSGDCCSDTLQPLEVSRRVEIRELVRGLAARRGVSFATGRILTHTGVVLTRSERLRLFELTGCSVVQMEHGWFLRLLRSLLEPERFAALRVIHLEVVTDRVPPRPGWRAVVREAWHAADDCVLRNQGGLGRLKIDFLRTWLCI